MHFFVTIVFIDATCAHAGRDSSALTFVRYSLLHVLKTLIDRAAVPALKVDSSRIKKKALAALSWQT